MAKLTFRGEQATVTGSCFLLETDHLKILVDCGMFPGEKRIADTQLPQPFSAAQYH